MNTTNAPLADPKTYIQTADLSGGDLIGYKEITNITTYGEESIREMAKRGEFPLGTRLGPKSRRLLWPRSMVLAWLAAKIEANNACKAVDTQGGGN